MSTMWTKGRAYVAYWGIAAAVCAAIIALPGESQSQFGIPGPFATFQGVVTEAYGPAPVYLGAPCSVTTEPSSGTYNCRIRVTCNGQMLYGSGSSGYNHCQIRAAIGSMPTMEIHDRGFSYSDGDPQLDAYLPAGPVSVTDRMGPVTWRVSVGGLAPAF